MHFRVSPQMFPILPATLKTEVLPTVLYNTSLKKRRHWEQYNLNFCEKVFVMKFKNVILCYALQFYYLVMLDSLSWLKAFTINSVTCCDVALLLNSISFIRPLASSVLRAAGLGTRPFESSDLRSTKVLERFLALGFRESLSATDILIDFLSAPH